MPDVKDGQTLLSIDEASTEDLDTIFSFLNTLNVLVDDPDDLHKG